MFAFEELDDVIDDPANGSIAKPGALQVLPRPRDGGLGSVEMGDTGPCRSCR